MFAFNYYVPPRPHDATQRRDARPRDAGWKARATSSSELLAVKEIPYDDEQLFIMTRNPDNRPRVLAKDDFLATRGAVEVAFPNKDEFVRLSTISRVD